MTCFECVFARYRYPHPVEQRQDKIVISKFKPRSNNYTMNKMYFVTLTCPIDHFIVMRLVTGLWMQARLEVNLLSWRPHLVCIRTTWFTQQKQWCLHKNKVICNLAAIQSPDHWTHKYKAVYRWFQIKSSHMSNFKSSTSEPYLIALPFWSRRAFRCSRSGANKETYLKNRWFCINILTVAMIR